MLGRLNVLVLKELNVKRFGLMAGVLAVGVLFSACSQAPAEVKGGLEPQFGTKLVMTTGPTAVVYRTPNAVTTYVFVAGRN